MQSGSQPERSCLAGDGVGSLGHWSLALWSDLTVGEMVQGGDRLFLLNRSYRRWWQLLHPALVTCGRETALPSESLVLVVLMLRVASWRVPRGTVCESLDVGCGGWSLPDDCSASIYSGRKSTDK